MNSVVSVTLDGFNLDPKALWQAATRALDPKAVFKIVLSAESVERIKKSEAFVEKIVQKAAPVYGINTGFGKFAEVAISKDQLGELQENLIHSHACGVGEPFDRDIVMSMWLIRLNVLSRGNSGVRLETIQKIIRALEAGILAEVPMRGSVGASGDLAPSAHATLALLGHGTCSRPKGASFERVDASVALKEAGLTPVVLHAKEGLGLINGTQTTTSLALKSWYEGARLLKTANLATALSIEALRGSHAIFNPLIAKARNHQGAVVCAQEVFEWVQGDTEISKSHEGCGRVQDAYSLRCAPQVHGAIWETLHWSEQILKNELNSSTDNPLIFADEGLSLSGGNFHALYTARVSDTLASALTTLSSISERRIALLMSKESSTLPPFLTQNGGLNSGFMMAQVTAAALVSESKTLSFPASVDSIPTSDDREDHVSMGVGAGLKLQQIVSNLTYVLSIELLCAAQALDFLRPLKSSAKLERVHSKIRKTVSKLERDRNLSVDFEAVTRMIKCEDLLTA